MNVKLAEAPMEASNSLETRPFKEQASNQDILTAAKGGGISFASRVFEYATRFIFGILIARALGVEQYGLFTLIITVALFATNTAMLGLQVGMVRFLPPAIREKDDETVRGIIQVCTGLPALFSLALGAGLLFFADPLASLVFHDPRLTPLLRTASLLIPIDTLGFMAYTITISYKQPQYSALANHIITPLAKLLLAVGFLALGLSTQGIVVSQVLATLIGLGVMVYYVNSLFSLRRFFQITTCNTRQLLRYSLPAYLGWMVNTIRSTLSTMVLGLVGLTAGVGVFSAASRFSLIGSMFYLSIGNISTPIIADLHSRREAAQMKAYYQTTTRWLVMFNLPLFLTSALFARPLLSIFGDDFTAGATSMMILAVGTLAYTGTGVGANILDMTDHPKVNTANSVVMVFITIALNLLLIPHWGVMGAAAASALSTVLVNLLCLIEVWYLLGMQPYHRGFLKLLAAGLLSAGLTWFLIGRMSLPLLMELLVGGAALWGIYLLALLAMGLPESDLMVMKRLWAHLNFRRIIPGRLGG